MFCSQSEHKSSNLFAEIIYFDVKPYTYTALLAAARDGRNDNTMLLLDRGANIEGSNNVTGYIFFKT